MKAPKPAPIAWLAPLLVGAGFGAFIGFLVAYLRIPSIVVTLGMLSIIKGILIIWVQGQRVQGMPEAYFLSQMRPLGIPMPIIIMTVLTIAVVLWMRYSATGRAFYALGGNAEAARLSGLSQKRLLMTVFILNGIFIGIASVIYSTQFNIIQATPPPALELSVITASVVGGVSILGGTGTAIGSTLATLLLNFIRSAIPPATIVAAAPQNAAWNSQKANRGMSAPDSEPIRRKPVVPKNGFPSENMIA